MNRLHRDTYGPAIVRCLEAGGRREKMTWLREKTWNMKESCGCDTWDLEVGSLNLSPDKNQLKRSETLTDTPSQIHRGLSNVLRLGTLGLWILLKQKKRKVQLGGFACWPEVYPICLRHLRLNLNIVPLTLTRFGDVTQLSQMCQWSLFVFTKEFRVDMKWPF